MRMSKRRAFIGYQSRAVEQLVLSMKQTFEEEKSRLEAEFAALTKGNMELAEQIGQWSRQANREADDNQRDAGAAARRSS